MPHTLLWQWVRPRWRSWVLPGLVALLMIYTADQLLTGERGMLTWRVMRAQITELQQDLTLLKVQIDQLNHEIDRLKGTRQPDGHYGPPDKDFVDEILRRDLGVLKDGEMVILLPAAPSPTNLLHE
jgi:cell division protein FtsB